MGWQNIYRTLKQTKTVYYYSLWHDMATKHDILCFHTFLPWETFYSFGACGARMEENIDQSPKVFAVYLLCISIVGLNKRQSNRHVLLLQWLWFSRLIHVSVSFINSMISHSVCWSYFINDCMHIFVALKLMHSIYFDFFCLNLWHFSDGGSLSPIKSHHMIRRPGELCVSSRSGGGVGRQRRRQTSVERENQERIDRENRILLRKILEQHHGVRRSSAIPPPPNKAHKQKYPLSSTGKYFLQQEPLTCDKIFCDDF